MSNLKDLYKSSDKIIGLYVNAKKDNSSIADVLRHFFPVISHVASVYGNDKNSFHLRISAICNLYNFIKSFKSDEKDLIKSSYNNIFSHITKTAQNDIGTPSSESSDACDTLIDKCIKEQFVKEDLFNKIFKCAREGHRVEDAKLILSKTAGSLAKMFYVKHWAGQFPGYEQDMESEGARIFR